MTLGSTLLFHGPCLTSRVLISIFWKSHDFEREKPSPVAAIYVDLYPLSSLIYTVYLTPERL